jgi:hypothetical protein
MSQLTISTVAEQILQRNHHAIPRIRVIISADHWMPPDVCKPSLNSMSAPEPM